MNQIKENEPVLKALLKIESIVLGSLATFIVALYFLIPLNKVESDKTPSYITFYQWYWLIFGLLFLAVLVYFIVCYIFALKNKKTLMYTFALNSVNYGFLLKQLISRDFKTKYKRSVLGVLWSFLNPLLMMGVQYIIFSTLFGNQNIPYYPVYLLIGVVFFQFMNDTVSPGLTAITGNAPLLNKVPMPKRLFPLSKVFSTSINFAFSLIPLLLVMLICQKWPTWTNLLIIVDYILIFIFIYGLTLFLSAAMVYFRDVQFLWGIFSMLWMYATPIFYSIESIQIPWVKTGMKFNPMYQYITFARECLINGKCPSGITFGACIACSVLMFAIGMLLFKKKEKDFVLHL